MIPTPVFNTPASVEQLMELAAVIADLSASPRAFQKVAQVMADLFRLPMMSIAVVDVIGPLRPSRVVLESCFANSTTPQTAPLPPANPARDVGTLDFSTAPDGHAGLEIAIDSRHKLIIRYRAPSDWSAPQAATFDIALRHLVKTIRATVLWQANPQTLGQPYDRLTEREWMVLVGLNSEDGEKQLADRLSLSPHTLHSHIKSIYRKLGVQGRLSLMQKFSTSVVDYRHRMFSGTPDSLTLTN